MQQDGSETSEENAADHQRNPWLLRVGVLAVCVGLSGLIYWYSASQKPTTSSNCIVAGEPKSVTVNQAFEHLLYLGLYVAQDSCLFAQEGLEVAIETGGGDYQAFSALASRSAQFAQGDPAFVAIAALQGFEARVVGMAVDRVAIWGVAKEGEVGPFVDPEGFRGRRVSTFPKPNTSYVVQEELAQRAGLVVGQDVAIVEVQFGSEIAALERGEVDIAQTIEPNASTYESQGGEVVFSYPEAWGPLAFTGIMTTQEMIGEDPETVQKFLNAYEKAMRIIQNDPATALKIAANRFPEIDEAILGKALGRLSGSGAFPSTTVVDPASWQSLLEVRVRVGDLPAIPERSLVDNEFALKAARAIN